MLRLLLTFFNLRPVSLQCSECIPTLVAVNHCSLSELDHQMVEVVKSPVAPVAQVPGLTPPDLAAYNFDNRGAAIECRINAENPSSNYSPSAGALLESMPICTATPTGS